MYTALVPAVRTAVAALLVSLPLAACSSDDVTAPPPVVEGVFTVDARTEWQYLSLVDSAVVSPAPSAPESAAWDIGFNATNVVLNGGAAGPAGVAAFCICQNASATNEEVLAMTAASEKADYDAVTSVPGGAVFTTDAFATHRYFRYNILGDHRISPTFDVYLVKRGTDVFKLQVVSYYNAAAQARHITFRYKQISG